MYIFFLICILRISRYDENENPLRTFYKRLSEVKYNMSKKYVSFGHSCRMYKKSIET